MGAVGITNIDLAEVGAWEARTQLTFLSDPDHPAANILEDVTRPDDASGAAVQRLVVEVDTLDNLAAEHGLERPRLVSITTNGAELQIVAGMKAMLADGYPEYIALAQTRPGYVEAMADVGYEHIALDDRGYCFRRVGTPGD
jgi:FkbM family methyltransferase